MAISTITLYTGVTPDRSSQSQATFSAAANTWTAYQADVLVSSINVTVGEMNAAVDQINDDLTASQAAVLEAQTAALDAQTAATTAQSSAAFKGRWSDLTGALNVPSSVLHNSAYWQLVTDLSDATASEPSVTNPDWVKITNVETGITNSAISHFYRNR